MYKTAVYTLVNGGITGWLKMPEMKLQDMKLQDMTNIVHWHENDERPSDRCQSRIRL